MLDGVTLSDVDSVNSCEMVRGNGIVCEVNVGVTVRLLVREVTESDNVPRDELKLGVLVGVRLCVGESVLLGDSEVLLLWDSVCVPVSDVHHVWVVIVRVLSCGFYLLFRRMMICKACL